MKELAPVLIEKHNTQVTVEVVTDSASRFHMNLIVRGLFTGEQIGKLSIGTGSFDTEMTPEKEFLVADSIHRALQVWPESHPHVMDALTWESIDKWDSAMTAIESARIRSRAGSLQLV